MRQRTVQLQRKMVVRQLQIISKLPLPSGLDVHPCGDAAAVILDARTVDVEVGTRLKLWERSFSNTDGRPLFTITSDKPLGANIASSIQIDKINDVVGIWKGIETKCGRTNCGASQS